MIKKNLNASVVFHAIKLSETWKKNGDLITQNHGITTQQWLILLLLAKDPNIMYFRDNPQEKPMMAKELAEAMNVSRANITNLLNVLLKKKLITQAEDGEDRRRKRLKLTQQGEKLLESLEQIRHKYNTRLFSKFSKEEKETFVGFIDTCLMAMQDGRLVKDIEK
jgi:DNA-binding MarR family transcriptional regulator